MAKITTKLAFVFLALSLALSACSEKDKKVVVCWGDSLTAPHAAEHNVKDFVKRTFGKENCYPSQLQDLLGDDYQVVNCGVGGERTLDIMARQGSLPLMLAHDVTVYDQEHSDDPVFVGNRDIPGLVTVWKDSIHTLNILRRGWEDWRSARVNPVTAEGDSYTLVSDGKMATSSFYETNTWLVPDAYPEKTKTLPKGTCLQTAAARELRNADINIFFVGANGGYDSLQDYVEQLQTMIDYSQCKDYYVISFHVTNNEATKTLEDLTALEDTLQMLHGDRFINLRRELGCAPDEYVDPKYLIDDRIHFNDAGCTQIANIVAARIKK